MVTTHNLGFPRIGERRELKFALEKYWAGEISAAALEQAGAELRARHWQTQADLTLLPVGEFSYYDQVLDMSTTLGHLPPRITQTVGADSQRYFRAARGRAPGDTSGVQAGEMTKWFDTNYHYIVPEFTADTSFSLQPGRLLAQLAEAKQQRHAAKPVIIGPVTYLWLGKAKDDTNKLDLLERLLPVYGELLDALAEEGAEWVQIDEPALVCDLNSDWQQAFRTAYRRLQASVPKLLLATYFGPLQDNLPLACELPVQGLHLDAINARDEIARAIELLDNNKTLSLGVVDGRNVWKTDLQRTLEWLKPLHQQLGSRLWLAPSCSLLHVPVNLELETTLAPEIKTWLAFAVQKLEELQILARALAEGEAAVAPLLKANAYAIASRRESVRVHDPAVQKSVAAIDDNLGRRHSPYSERASKQTQHLCLPLLPATTIGSFPQTPDIRRVRLQYRRGELDRETYIQRMQQEIEYAVREQEALGLDVLVHGEAERNDMVEYFGQQLRGFTFTQFGWVQSYGSRCVKPPILYGDVSRPASMTVEWINYARSLTDKPVKGMLTGPVTILNWSFVRDDQTREQTCYQLALAIRDEVLDLERAGVRIIQIDEAALREGLPLRRSQWHQYLAWAIEAFRITANGVDDATQIHTHMCYSEFNDIIDAIAAMDADVITIESSRSQMELLDAFDRFDYPNEIGPGVYDIHSPNIPGVEEIIHLLEQAAAKIPPRRLWVNPDCGLKTRRWEEVAPALKNMVAAAGKVRQELESRVSSRQSPETP